MDNEAQGDASEPQPFRKHLLRADESLTYTDDPERAQAEQVSNLVGELADLRERRDSLQQAIDEGTAGPDAPDRLNELKQQIFDTALELSRTDIKNGNS